MQPSHPVSRVFRWVTGISFVTASTMVMGASPAIAGPLECGGERVTIIDTHGDDTIHGTPW